MRCSSKFNRFEVRSVRGVRVSIRMFSASSDAWVGHINGDSAGIAIGLGWNWLSPSLKRMLTQSSITLSGVQVVAVIGCQHTRRNDLLGIINAETADTISRALSHHCDLFFCPFRLR